MIQVCELVFVRFDYNLYVIFRSMSLISFYPGRNFFLPLDIRTVRFEFENYYLKKKKKNRNKVAN